MQSVTQIHTGTHTNTRTHKDIQKEQREDLFEQILLLWRDMLFKHKPPQKSAYDSVSHLKVL